MSFKSKMRKFMSSVEKLICFKENVRASFKIVRSKILEETDTSRKKVTRDDRSIQVMKLVGIFPMKD